ncbi:hypothetical protein JTE90_016770 [Oedothorax gibbosus]|uniref:Fibrinogen C-terminal domain-containing protein n=1 Tax=Oedothorax gibbosus TaxID=931172 RepID=A0AAV6VZL2_9ARAC|nr:hypothetical protein JTE90_016770 [Oedothorax gibbosus]
MASDVKHPNNLFLFFVDCSGNASWGRPSGPYLIRGPEEGSARRVYCDTGSWTVVQRREKGGTLHFDRDWAQYKRGFGDVDGNFWIGNDLLHHITAEGEEYALRMDLWDAQGTYKFAEYSTFRVLGEHDHYRLVLAGYRGNASDAMGYHNGMAFSTPDRDNDASEATHCADFYQSGWWYNHCQYVNVNGRTGITWYDMEGQEWSELSKVEMKIKPKALL